MYVIAGDNVVIGDRSIALKVKVVVNCVLNNVRKQYSLKT